ncbi:MAG TPA: CHAT domain-containing protein [Thermoanaerobaculia bacterium]|nr:CHAT domain-containing protein [Thermoanaerobaculia bacterium]
MIDPTTKKLGFVTLAVVLAGTFGSFAVRLRVARDDTSAKLAQALGEIRFIAPRLSGELSFVPCLPVERASALLASVRCRAAGARPGSAESLHALSRLATAAPKGSDERQLAALAIVAGPSKTSQLAAAVRSLAALVERAPGDPDLLNEVAVARLVYATELDEPQELVFALEASERAVRAAPDRLEILFNRALALETAGLLDRAILGWEGYLTRDENSGWAGEARRHLERLRSPGIPERWRALRARLDGAALAGDAESVRRIVALAPQEARETAIEEILGRWGDRVRAGQEAETDRDLRIAAAIGTALEHETGDPTVTRAVAVLQSLSDASQNGLRLRAARGHAAYRDGIAHFRRLEIEAAEPAFATARADLAALGSPVELWARYGSAGCALLRSRYDEARAELAALARAAPADVHPVLRGRIEWAFGLASVRQGRFEQALEHDLEAVRRFTAVRERQGLAAVHGLLAEDLDHLGQTTLGWRHRFRALFELAGDRDSLRLHNVLWEGGHSAVKEGAPLAALQFQDEGLLVDRRADQPQRIAETLLWRSKTYIALGQPRQALAALASARLICARSSGAWVRDRVAMDIELATGEALRRIDPRAALEPAGRALAYYRERGLKLDLADALLSSARAARGAGQPQEAVAHLDEAIDLFERQRSSVGERTTRFSFSETVQPVYDERIRHAIEISNDPQAGFLLSERARTVPLASIPSVAVASITLNAIQRALPEDDVLLEYALVEDRLYLWKVTRREFAFMARRIAPERLDRVVESFVSDIKNGLPKSRWRDRSAWLRELLLPSGLALSPGATLRIVPDKALNALPFSALRSGETGRFLVEDHALSLLPSASCLLAPRSARPRANAPSALLIAATSWDRRIYPLLESLRSADGEVAQLARLYPTAALLSGADAKVEAVLRELPRHSVVHFAGHALVDAEDPASAQLVLAPSDDHPGALLASDIARLPLDRVELVVLAACETLGPRNARPTGIAGLARPFLDAGARSVVGSLWNLGDRDASPLLARFHRAWIRVHQPAESLRASQLEMLRSGDPKLSRPSVWAGAQVVGWD